MYALGSTGVYKSEDGGVTWSTPVAIPRIPGSLGLYVNPEDANTMFALTGALRKSEDGGQVWRTIGETEIGIVNALLFDPNDSSIIHAATANAGFIVSRDGGEMWKTMDVPMGALPMLTSLSLDEATGTVYAGTFNHGVLTRPIQLTEAPSELALPDGGGTETSPNDDNVGANVGSSGGGGALTVSADAFLVFLLSLGWRTLANHHRYKRKQSHPQRAKTED